VLKQRGITTKGDKDMFTVTVILVFALVILMFVVNFVLTNIEMFQTPFDIVISFPLIKWSHTWEGIEFMYIIAGSVLLGALVVALSTWVLDTKRKLRLRSMRKELNRLKEALQEATASLPEANTSGESTVSEDEQSEDTGLSSSVTPEEITKSFENVVQDSDFLQESSEKFDENATLQTESTEKGDMSDAENQLPQETPIEAELVDSEEPPEGKRTKTKEE
jgi:ABC-type multidrug transport system fused ATPase/permease subunit